MDMTDESRSPKLRSSSMLPSMQLAVSMSCNGALARSVAGDVDPLGRGLRELFRDGAVMVVVVLVVLEGLDLVDLLPVFDTFGAAVLPPERVSA